MKENLWELIEETKYAISDRLWVHNGWIVRTVVYSEMYEQTKKYNTATGVNQVFVEDRLHAWKL